MFFSFGNLKDDEKQDLRIHCYETEFINKLSVLLKIEHDEFCQTSQDICKLLFTEGLVGCVKYSEGYWFGKATRCGKLDKNGKGINARVAFGNGTVYEGEVGKDVVLLYANTLGTPKSKMVSRFSQMLADIDLSLVYNLYYSRVCPIPVVRTDNEKRSLEEVVKGLFAGKMSIFKRETSVADFNGKTANADSMLNLTNPSTSEYIQHLSRLHDEITIRACTEMGIHVSARDKGAQLNESELQAFNDYCAVNGTVLTLCLDNFKKDMKKCYGIDVTAEVRNFIYNDSDVEMVDNTETEKESAENGDKNINGDLDSEE